MPASPPPVDITFTATTPAVEVQCPTEETTAGGSPGDGHVLHDSSLGTSVSEAPHTEPALTDVHSPVDEAPLEGTPQEPSTGEPISAIPLSARHQDDPPSSPLDEEMDYEHDVGFEVTQSDDSKARFLEYRQATEIEEEEEQDDAEVYMEKDEEISTSEARQLIRQEYLSTLPGQYESREANELAEEINNKYKASLKYSYLLSSGISKDLEDIKDSQKQILGDARTANILQEARDKQLKTKLFSIERTLDTVLKNLSSRPAVTPSAELPTASTPQSQQPSSELPPDQQPKIGSSKVFTDAIDRIVGSMPKVDPSLSTKISMVDNKVSSMDIKIGLLDAKVEGFREGLKGEWTMLHNQLNDILSSRILPRSASRVPLRSDDDKKGEKGKAPADEEQGEKKNQGGPDSIAEKSGPPIGDKGGLQLGKPGLKALQEKEEQERMDRELALKLQEELNQGEEEPADPNSAVVPFEEAIPLSADDSMAAPEKNPSASRIMKVTLKATKRMGLQDIEVTLTRRNNQQQTVKESEIKNLNAADWTEMLAELPKKSKHTAHIKVLLENLLRHRKERRRLEAAYAKRMKTAQQGPGPEIINTDLPSCDPRTPGTIITDPEQGMFYLNNQMDLRFIRFKDLSRAGDDLLRGLIQACKKDDQGKSLKQQLELTLKNRADSRKKGAESSSAPTQQKK